MAETATDILIDTIHDSGREKIALTVFSDKVRELV
jgi:hypothetical protein